MGPPEDGVAVFLMPAPADAEFQREPKTSPPALPPVDAVGDLADEKDEVDVMGGLAPPVAEGVCDGEGWTCTEVK